MIDLNKLRRERDAACIDKADLFDFYHGNWDRLTAEIEDLREKLGIPKPKMNNFGVYLDRGSGPTDEPLLIKLEYPTDDMWSNDRHMMATWAYCEALRRLEDSEVEVYDVGLVLVDEDAPYEWAVITDDATVIDLDHPLGPAAWLTLTNEEA